LWFFTDAKVGIPAQGCKNTSIFFLAGARNNSIDNQQVTENALLTFLATRRLHVVNHQNPVVH
jgi:hypothetical protein